jgi:hypothetical protein
LETIKEQQKGTIEDNQNAYSFQRMTLNPTETLHHGNSNLIMKLGRHVKLL